MLKCVVILRLIKMLVSSELSVLVQCACVRVFVYISAGVVVFVHFKALFNREIPLVVLLISDKSISCFHLVQRASLCCNATIMKRYQHPIWVTSLKEISLNCSEYFGINKSWNCVFHENALIISHHIQCILQGLLWVCEIEREKEI